MPDVLHLTDFLPGELHHRVDNREQLLVVAIGHRAVLQELQQRALDMLNQPGALARVQHTARCHVVLMRLLELVSQVFILLLQFLHHLNGRL